MRAMRLFDLSGRAALITGGNGGLGLAMARGLAEAGADVALVARNAEKSAAAAAGIRRDFPAVRVVTVQADVTDESAVRAAVDGVAADLGRLDVLINNAGTNIRKPPQDYTLAEWEGLLRVNLTSAFLCCRAAHPHFRRAGRGKVINIGSMTTVFGGAWAGPYSATKGGISQYTKSLAVAWAADNVQVNCLLPGWIDTELSREARRVVPGLEAKVVARTPAGRLGRPEDLAGTAVFLASSASDFVTGVDLPVDGGYVAAL